jgi:hypothetical protein
MDILINQAVEAKEPVVDPAVLTDSLLKAGLPVQSVDSNGKVVYATTLTAAQKEISQTIIAQHDSHPEPPAYRRRMEMLANRGVPLERLLMALFDKAAFNDGVEISRILEEVAWN